MGQLTVGDDPNWVPATEINVMGQTLSTEPQACELPIRPPTDPTGSFAIVSYGAASGTLSVAVSPPAEGAEQPSMSALRIQAAKPIFTGSTAAETDGPFDASLDNLIFKLFPSGFSKVDFGDVAATAMSNNELASDLCVTGAWVGGGELGTQYHYPGAGEVPLRCAAADQAPVDVGLIYDPESGEMWVDVESELSDSFTTLEISSASGVLTGEANGLSGEFDTKTSERLLKQNADGFGDIGLGTLVTPGLSIPFLRDDLGIDGTFFKNSRIGSVSVRAVPEPSSLMLLGLASVPLLSVTRRRISAR